METVWILAVYLLGLTAMVLEMFLPGAVIGTMGFLAVCGSIIYAFAKGYTVTGTVLTGTTIALIPVFFLVWRDVLSRFMSLKADEKGYRVTTTVDESLLGKQGHALSQLRPSGTAQIDGRRHSVVTRGELLPKGTQLKVIEVAGNRIVVKSA